MALAGATKYYIYFYYFFFRFKMAQKSRSFCYTLNNPKQAEFDALKCIKCKYQVIGKEIGEKGTPHLQGFIYFENARSFNAVRKTIRRWHLEICKGNIEQNITYCKKDGEFIEIGEAPKQGKRNDLDAIKNDIMNGKKVEDLILEQPNAYHQYGRTLSKIEDITMRKKFRTEMTKGTWIWGETGAGKSHMAFENYTPETHYVYPNDGGWWDAYQQQKIVIFNDFRGEIKYNELLNIVDKWPYFVRRRNREPMPFISDHVIITSSLPPDEIYHNRNDEDKIEQLLRRFEIIHKSKNGTEVVGGNTETPTEVDPKEN